MTDAELYRELDSASVRIKQELYRMKKLAADIKHTQIAPVVQSDINHCYRLMEHVQLQCHRQ